MSSILTTVRADEDVDMISLGNIRPEGIHILPKDANSVMGLVGEGTFALVSDILWGSIRVVNLDTSETFTLVESLGYGSRSAAGMWYTDGAIFVGKNCHVYCWLSI